MKLRVNHTTEYAYDAPVSYGLQKLRLRPRSDPMQEVADWDISVEGGRIETSYRDHHGNHVDLVSIDPGAQVLRVSASGTVDTLSDTGVLGQVFGRAPLWYFKEQTRMTEPGPAIEALPALSTDPQAVVPGLHALSAAIIEALPYRKGGTGVNTTAEEAMAGDTGVCQDHAQIFVSAARLSGLPARYVSGYLMLNGQIDQEATHAWAEVCIDGLGWVGFDVSNGVSPDERYIRLAVGRDARDAAPVEGLRMGVAEETLVVSLQVQQ